MRNLETRQLESERAALSGKSVGNIVIAGVVGGTVETGKEYLDQRKEIEPTVPKEKGKLEREGEIFRRTDKTKLAVAFARGAVKDTVEQVVVEAGKNKPKDKGNRKLYKIAA